MEDKQQWLHMNTAVVMILVAVTACASHAEDTGEGEVRAKKLPR